MGLVTRTAAAATTHIQRHGDDAAHAYCVPHHGLLLLAHRSVVSEGRGVHRRLHCFICDRYPTGLSCPPIPIRVQLPLLPPDASALYRSLLGGCAGGSPPSPLPHPRPVWPLPPCWSAIRIPPASWLPIRHSSRRCAARLSTRGVPGISGQRTTYLSRARKPVWFLLRPIALSLCL